MAGIEQDPQQKDTLVTPEKKNTNKYALLSVSDKTGIVDLARSLNKLGYKIISTGGTAKVLEAGGINVVPIQEITGNPESFDGRMKTISFQIESGILFDRQKPSHVKEAKDLNVKPIDIVVCNLYPFEKTIQNPDVTLEEAVENIDVGGPTMVRAAAKNFKNVLVVTDPKNYEKVAKALETNSVTDELRQALSAKAFYHLSFYDSLIAQFLNREKFPEEMTLPGRRTPIKLRYGENPHQKKTGVYFEPITNSPLVSLQKHTGRELSYVNLTDISAGLESVRLFEEPAAVVIKHNSPSGIALASAIALGGSPAEALTRAVAADPASAFGGAIVLNQPLDAETAETFAKFREENGVVIDIVAAPSITDEASDFINKVRKSTGIYTFGEIPKNRSNPIHKRFFDGGWVSQEWDDGETEIGNWEVAGKLKPTFEEWQQMGIAWDFIRRIRSNAVIVVDKAIPMTRGIGSGQTSRVRSARIALEQAGEHTKGAILASDSFFPFPDSVELAAKYGIGAIVQQGGSVNDKASIEAADKAGIPMVFTHQRAFWH